MKVTVAKRLTNGKKAWCVDWTEIGNGRFRRFFKKQDAANRHAESIRLDHRTNGEGWLELTEAEQYELITVWNEVKLAGLSIRSVWERFRAQPAPGDGPALDTVITDLVLAKSGAGRSNRYTKTLKTVLDQFARGRGAVEINRLGLADVEAFLNSKALASRSTLRARLSTLFKFAIRRGYRIDNPCARLEPITIHSKPPQVFTPAEYVAVVKFLRKHWREALPWFVLSTLCGLRPEEADKTTRAEIHLKEGWIKVEAQTTKVRQRRVVYPKREALTALRKSLRGITIPIGRSSRRRAIRDVRDHLGWKEWPKDITRHTAASYWLADTGNASKLSEQLGHSEKTMKKHYKALVTKEHAKQFWQKVRTA